MEEQVKKSWFRRNWLWFVPSMGCLTIIVLFILGIGALLVGVTNILSGSAPSEHAFEKASENKQVIRFLGKPIEQKGMTTGSINFNNGDGSADLIIPIKGPKGKAVLRVVAEKFNDVWTYEKLYVTIKETNEEINLLDKSLEGN
jgi:hypothetical protein